MISRCGPGRCSTKGSAGNRSATLRGDETRVPFLLALGAWLALPAPISTASLDADIRAARRAPGRTEDRQRRRRHAKRDAAADDRESVGVRSRVHETAAGDRRRPRRRREGRAAVIDAVRWMKSGAPERFAIGGPCRRCRWPILTAVPRRSPTSFLRPGASTKTRNNRRAATSGAGWPIRRLIWSSRFAATHRLPRPPIR